MNRRQRPGSLARRIVATTALVTALGMIALTVLVAVVLARLVDDNVARSLHARAAAVTSVLAPIGGSIRMQETSSDYLESETWIYDASGRLVEGGRAPSAVLHEIAALRTVATTTTVRTDGWSLRANPVYLSAGAPSSGVVVVGARLAPYQWTEATAIALTAAVGALVVVGVVLVARWTVARSLAPVQTMARRAEEWSESDLSRRFALGEPGDEITRLGAVLDALLDRVAQAILAEQRLSAELAHELRTPLTVIRAEAELGSTDPSLPPASADRFEQIVSSADRMNDVIETLLSLARGTTPPMETSAAAGILSRAAAEAQDPSVQVLSPPAASVAVPASFAVRTLAPLVQNAIEHAASRVWLEARTVPGAVEFLVRDDGSGPAGIEDEDLFRPGARGADSAGAGLGLALARRLARAAGGDVEFRGAPPTTFVLRLPVARPTATIPAPAEPRYNSAGR